MQLMFLQKTEMVEYKSSGKEAAWKAAHPPVAAGTCNESLPACCHARVVFLLVAVATQVLHLINCNSTFPTSGVEEERKGGQGAEGRQRAEATVSCSAMSNA
jgi:hypothetical protein